MQHLKNCSQYSRGESNENTNGKGGKDGSDDADLGSNDANLSADMKNKKRFRRTANAIERRFTCWCGKAYGSEGSLN